jgi:hypothetical protein
MGIKSESRAMQVRASLAALLCTTTIMCNYIPAETPQDFAIVFKSTLGGAFTLDTFNGTFRRVTMSAGDTTIAIRLQKVQIDSVYALIKEIDFFSLPESLAPKQGVTMFPSPSSDYLVRSNGRTKHVSASGFPGPDDRRLEELYRLNKLLIGMVTNSEEYRRLPPSADRAL